jgi:hypothetical protein
MDTERVPMDLGAYERRIRRGRCFVCAIVNGDAARDHEEIVFMLENGVIPWSRDQARSLAAELRGALGQG